MSKKKKKKTITEKSHGPCLCIQNDSSLSFICVGTYGMALYHLSVQGHKKFYTYGVPLIGPVQLY